jgi:Mn-containing catalase
MFHAALETIQPNFPMGTRQSDPRYSNSYFNLSSGGEARGPWNEGQSPDMGEEWVYVEDPIAHVRRTQGMVVDHEPRGTGRTEAEVQEKNEQLSKQRSEEVKSKLPKGANQWCSYPQEGLASPMGIETEAR